MSKHTPGPWQWWDEDTGRPKEYDLAKLFSPNVGRHILTLFGGPGQKALGKDDEAHANARLIAAAPEMLELLKKAQKALDVKTAGKIRNEPIFPAINSLLAKIEGE